MPGGGVFARITHPACAALGTPLKRGYFIKSFPFQGEGFRMGV